MAPPSVSSSGIKLLAWQFRVEKEREGGLNRALAVDLKVCAGSSGRKSRPV